MKKNKGKILGKRTLLVVTCVEFIFLIIGLFYSSFSLPEPIRSISFASEKLNYNEKTPGSWKVEKSAEWIDRGKARITIDIDTILKEKEEGIDLILVFDTSESMRGEKLEKEKEASIKLIEKVLSNSNNRVALVEHYTSSNILLGFTNDGDSLIDKINNLEANGSSYYYSALTGISSVLGNYKNSARNCMALLITSKSVGSSDSEMVSTINQFRYLKSSYPYVSIHTVQYNIDKEVLEPIKRVSDFQYVADINTIEQVLLNIPINSLSYDEFTLTEYINTNNFYIEGTSDIKVNEGSISFNKEEQKISWTLNSLKSGLKPRMTIDVKLKEELLDIGGIYSTSEKTMLHTKIGEDIEDVLNMETPVIKDNYQVTFEANAPEGCSVSNAPENRNQFVFDKVDISTKPTCSGYQFKGWEIITEEVNQINDDYFVMPSSDVVLRGEWSKMSISKSMNGEIYVGPPSIIRKVEGEDNEDIWQYKSTITKVVFENKIDESHMGLESFDISEEKNSSVMAYYDSSTTTVYIQGNKTVYANVDSTALFQNFTNLKQIEGLEYFDTSNAASMIAMFNGCSSLISLNLSNFDTSNVTNMVWMFQNCKSLTSLDLSSFDTSKVANMGFMFYQCEKVANLNLGPNFDTHNVVSMNCMFMNLWALTQLNLGDLFITSNVTDMSGMFSGCMALRVLYVRSNFDTSSVTDMSYMFNNCRVLGGLDLGEKFDTSKVTDMSYMFGNCYSMTTTITISNPNVTSYSYMFRNAYKAHSGTITVNYTQETSSLVDKMIATKDSYTGVDPSGKYLVVVKGIQVD